MVMLIYLTLLKEAHDDDVDDDDVDDGDDDVDDDAVLTHLSLCARLFF